MDRVRLPHRRPGREGRLITTDDGYEHAIRELVAQAQEAQNDPEALLPLHTAEVVIVNLAGRRVLGRQAFAEAMAAALASPLSDVQVTLEVLDIRLALPDVAIVSCLKTVRDDRSAADVATALPSTGAISYVVTRADGRWRIALAQTTPLLTAPNDGD